MASKLEVIKADSLEELVKMANEYMNTQTTDTRITVDVAGGVSYLPELHVYVIPLIINVPFKRTLDPEGEDED